MENSAYSNRGRSLALSRTLQSKKADAPEENLQLVPCRWSHTGWKYVQADPAGTVFFNSPNRVNSFGFNTGKAKKLA